MKHLTLLVIIIICATCTTTNRISCDNASYTSSYYDGYARYLFAQNVLPYEGYTNLETFLPSEIEINITDSVVSVSGLNLDEVKFAQYCGFITDLGERIIASIYVYKEIKEYPQARCNWFFGLGDYFEEFTYERYVNVVTKTSYKLK